MLQKFYQLLYITGKKMMAYFSPIKEEGKEEKLANFNLFSNWQQYMDFL